MQQSLSGVISVIVTFNISVCDKESEDDLYAEINTNLETDLIEITADIPEIKETNLVEVESINNEESQNKNTIVHWVDVDGESSNKFEFNQFMSDYYFVIAGAAVLLYIIVLLCLVLYTKQN